MNQVTIDLAGLEHNLRVVNRWVEEHGATWTLVTTMASLGLWLLAPPSWRIVPHPIYFTWLVSLVTFFLVTVLDRRRIQV